jgi:hypothetical protein
VFWVLPQHALNNLFPVAWNSSIIYWPRESSYTFRPLKLQWYTHGYSGEEKYSMTIITGVKNR